MTIDNPSAGAIQIGVREAKCTVVEVVDLPAVDRQYHHVVLRVYSGENAYEVSMSGPDAQVLGHKLRVAGGWTENR